MEMPETSMEDVDATSLLWMAGMDRAAPVLIAQQYLLEVLEKVAGKKGLARMLPSLALDFCGLRFHLPLWPPWVNHSLQRSNWFNWFDLLKGWGKETVNSGLYVK